VAGHSKFKNIMHRKSAQDAKRAKVFGKFLRDISIAIKEGGGTDLKTNAPLRTAVTRAKQANVPNVNIDRVLKGNQDDAAVYESVRYEGIGPEGSAFIIELITDN
jgi:transcriptional/translational regulatory protein YebC/TACO1